MIRPCFTTKLLLLWYLGFSSIAFAIASEPVCIQEQETVRLSVLKISACLLEAEDVQATGSGDKPRVVTSIQISVENMAERPMELEYFSNPIRRFGFSIFHPDGENLAVEYVMSPVHAQASASTPALSDGRGYEHTLLAPGARHQFHYEIKNLLLKPLSEGVLYTVTIGSSVHYRFLDEPEGKAFQLRNDEEQKLKQFSKRLRFLNVRLK